MLDLQGSTIRPGIGCIVYYTYLYCIMYCIVYYSGRRRDELFTFTRVTSDVAAGGGRAGDPRHTHNWPRHVFLEIPLEIRYSV